MTRTSASGEYFQSVLPASLVSIGHLWLEESAEIAVTAPTHAITLLNATLDDYFRVNNDVNVDPDAVTENLI